MVTASANIYVLTSGSQTQSQRNGSFECELLKAYAQGMEASTKTAQQSMDCCLIQTDLQLIPFVPSDTFSMQTGNSRGQAQYSLPGVTCALFPELEVGEE